MKNIFIILFLLTIFSCSDTEFSSIYPANPPVDIELVLLTPGNLDPAYSAYAGDYLLLLRSENTKNARFGGFFIFIDGDETDVLEMSAESDALYIFGSANGEDSTIYNKGIDVQVAILFTDTTGPDNEITVNNQTYAITANRNKTAALGPPDWLAIRTYLYNSTTGEIIADETSLPGNAVEIP